MRRRIAGVLALAALAAVAWFVTRPNGDEASRTFAGTVEATAADLGFEIPGRLASLSAREGDGVASGDTIAALDVAELEAALEAARAQHTAALARLRELRSGSRAQEIASAEAALEAARHREQESADEAARARRLHDGGAISRQDLDRARTRAALDVAARTQAEQALALAREGPTRETVEVQEALVAQAEANVSRAAAARANAVIVAPFAGRVTIRHREPGETVAPGAPVVTLRDDGDRWVRIYVPGARVGTLSLGQGAHIESDAYPERSYEGRVTFIGSEAEFTPRNVQTSEDRTRLVYAVKVSIVGDVELDLKPGLPADVVFDPEEVS